MKASTNLKRQGDSGETLHPTQHPYRKSRVSTKSHGTAAPCNPQHNLLNHFHWKNPHKTPHQTPLQTPPTVPSAWNSYLPNFPPLSHLPVYSPKPGPKIHTPTTTRSRRFTPQPSKARQKAKSTSTEDSQELLGVALCTAEAKELPADFQFRWAPKPLLHFKQIKNKKKFQTRICSVVHPWWPPLFARLGVDIMLELKHPSSRKSCHFVLGVSLFMSILPFTGF